MSDPKRNAELGKIHIAKKQLGLTDDDYRAVLENVTGKNSAADLTAAERKAVLDRFAERGFKAKKPKKKNAKTPMPFQKVDGYQQKMIAALWRDIYNMGGINNPNASVVAWLQRMNICNVDHVMWMDSNEASAAIEALKRFKSRLKHKQAKEA